MCKYISLYYLLLFWRRKKNIKCNYTSDSGIDRDKITKTINYYYRLVFIQYRETIMDISTSDLDPITVIFVYITVLEFICAFTSRVLQ